MQNYIGRFFLIFIPLILSSCSFFFRSQKINIIPENEETIVKVNGFFNSPEEKLKIQRPTRFVLSEYQMGYQYRSRIVKPSVLNEVPFLTAGFWGAIMVTNPDPVAISYGTVFTCLDFLVYGKKHRQIMRLDALERLPSNKIDGIVVTPHPHLQNLDVSGIRIRKHRSIKSLNQSEQNKVTSSSDMIGNYKVYDELNSWLYSMKFQEPQKSLIADYPRVMQLDAEIKASYVDVLPTIGSKFSLQIIFYLCDHMGERRIPIEVKGNSQIFSDADSDNHNDSFIDAMQDGLVNLVSDPQFEKGVNDLYELLRNEKIDWAQLELSKPNILEPDFQEMVNAQITILDSDFHGSGCMISPDGYALASYGVIENKEEVDVQFSNGHKKKAKVIRKDPLSNITLLKIDTIGNASLPIPDGEIFKIGDDVFSVGTPVSKSLAQSLTSGIVSGNHIQHGINYIQTDVKVSRGDNGSPLINNRGQLIGIINEKYTGYSLEGLSFAVSSADLIDRLKLSFK